MPFAGLGLHILVALFFAVHAIRRGQQLYWLFILFSFPLLGSIVYFLVIYLPDSRLQHSARKVVVAAGKALDPSRELREARAAFDYTPTAQNQMRLAAALLEAGQAAEAAQNYEAALKGPFAGDLEIRLGAVRAWFACGHAESALSHLRTIRSTDAAFRAEQITLLMARALAAAGQHDQAQMEFESALIRYGSFEAQAEYAIWAFANAEAELGTRLYADIEQAMTRWNRHTKSLNAELLRRLQAAKNHAARA